MDYDQLMEVIRARRSVRNYKPDPVSDEIVNQVIEAAKWAPSGNNSQPWEIVVLKDKALMKKVNDILHEVHGSKSKQEFGAPVTLLVLGDPRYCDAYPKGPFREEIFHASLSAAIENMLLAATALGLGGSLWKTVSATAGVKIKDLLGIPQFYFLKVMLPLGYPTRSVKAPRKRDVIVHENRYDQAKLKSDEEVIKTIKEYSRFKSLNKKRVP
jgi:nitroreductase